MRSAFANGFVPPLVAAVAALFSTGPSAQVLNNFPTPSIAYFKSDWCPSLPDRARLQNIAPNYYAKGKSCCIERAILHHWVPLQKIADEFPDGFSETPDDRACTGFRPTDAEADDLLLGKITYSEINRRGQERAAVEATRKQAETAARAAADFAAAKKELPNLPAADACALWGRYVRSDAKELAVLYGAELRRRGIAPKGDTPMTKKIRIGDTRCTLLAAWGEPDAANRTVTAHSAHIQHVYGKSYVYTVNDRITAWQD